MNLFLQPLPSPPERGAAGPPRTRPALRKGKWVLQGSPTGLGRLPAELPAAAAAAMSGLSALEGARGRSRRRPCAAAGPFLLCARAGRRRGPALPGRRSRGGSRRPAAAAAAGPAIPPFLVSEVRVCY